VRIERSVCSSNWSDSSGRRIDIITSNFLSYNT
jgi:hypothetical protein